MRRVAVSLPALLGVILCALLVLAQSGSSANAPGSQPCRCRSPGIGFASRILRGTVDEKSRCLPPRPARRDPVCADGAGAVGQLGQSARLAAVPSLPEQAGAHRVASEI